VRLDDHLDAGLLHRLEHLIHIRLTLADMHEHDAGGTARLGLTNGREPLLTFFLLNRALTTHRATRDRVQRWIDRFPGPELLRQQAQRDALIRHRQGRMQQEPLLPIPLRPNETKSRGAWMRGIIQIAGVLHAKNHSVSRHTLTGLLRMRGQLLLGRNLRILEKAIGRFR
jgi:hypothetical protein